MERNAAAEKPSAGLNDVACGCSSEIETFAVGGITFFVFVFEIAIKVTQFGFAPVLACISAQLKCLPDQFWLLPGIELRVFAPVQGAAVQLRARDCESAG